MKKLEEIKEKYIDKLDTEIMENIKINDDAISTTEKISYLQHTLLLGKTDVESLSISKSANIIENRVSSINKATYDLTLSKIISPELAKFVFENGYYVQILISENLTSPILKIISISSDHNLSYNIKMRLE